jgi:hypothetical protein
MLEYSDVIGFLAVVALFMIFEELREIKNRIK